MVDDFTPPEAVRWQALQPALAQWITNMDADWRTRGVEWRVGLEHEFELEPQEVTPTTAQRREQLRRSLAEHFKHAPEKVAALATFSDTDLLLCALHEVWLANETEYRFGTQTDGKGYYDHAGIAEIRTPPLPPLAACEAHERSVGMIDDMAEFYGFTVKHLHNTHVNLSARDLATGQELTVCDSKAMAPLLDEKGRRMDCATFNQRATQGVFSMARQTVPLWIKDPASSPLDYLMTTHLGRGHPLRLHRDRVELRTPHAGDLPHSAATYVAMMLAGASYGLLEPGGAALTSQLGTTQALGGVYETRELLPHQKRYSSVEEVSLLRECLREAYINPKTHRLEPGGYAHRHFDQAAQHLFGEDKTPDDMEMELRKISVEPTLTGGKICYRGNNPRIEAALQSIVCVETFPTFHIQRDRSLRQLATEYQLPDGIEKSRDGMAVAGSEAVMQSLRQQASRAMSYSPSLRLMCSRYGMSELHEQLLHTVCAPQATVDQVGHEGRAAEATHRRTP